MSNGHENHLSKKYVEPPRLSNKAIFGRSPDPRPYAVRLYEEFYEYRAKLAQKGWKFLGSGRHRHVFLSPRGDRVIKVSYNPEGVRANLFEIFYAERGRSFIRRGFEGYVEVPIPRVFGSARVGHLSVMCVEVVERADNAFGLAKQEGFDWVYTVDSDGSPQVGFTSMGRLVAFDWCSF